MGSGGKSDLALPLSELEDYGGRLRDIKTRLNHTKKLFESYKDDLGDHTVYDALDDFESGWEDGREDIGQALDALAKMSDAVVREFKKLDDDLAKQVRDGVKQEDDKGARRAGPSSGRPQPASFSATARSQPTSFWATALPWTVTSPP